MGRKENDVFVLGDETLVAEPNDTHDANLVGDEDTTRDFGAEPAELYEPVTPAMSRSRVASPTRRFVMLGLGAGAATVVAVSAFAGGGGDEKSSPPPRSTSLVSSPPPLSAVTHKVAAPSPRPHRPAPLRVRRNAKPKRDVGNRHQRESQRETTHIEAPADSTVSIPPTSTYTVEAEPSPPPVTIPEPPSSPPPPAPESGGSSGARAEFSFEH